MTLHEINFLSPAEVETHLFRCCGSTRWATLMIERRPFRNALDLQSAAETIWWSLGKTDWLEAFSQHPKIGAKKVSAQWSEAEQAGMAKASSEMIGEMAELNHVYEQKFGWIFIVCATGKTGDQMRTMLAQRLANEKEDEIKIAAAEQAKITRLRLEKLLAE
jgi:OHCU decarboxylase